MVLREFGVPMEMEDYPTPEIGPGELLVRVGAAGLCATDIKVAQGKIEGLHLPVVPGHELAGEVLECGERAGANGWAPGDHVAIHMCMPCGQCRPCRTDWENNCERAERVGYDRPGGFGEVVAVPHERCARVSSDMPMEHAAILAGSIATPLHAIQRRAELQPDETIAIFGIGGLGIHALQVAADTGAKVIAIDIDDARLETARELGASATINGMTDVAAALRDVTDGVGVDVVASFVGGKAIKAVLPQALGGLRRCGRVVVAGYLKGVPIVVDSNDLVLQTWEIRGARSSTMADLHAAVELVEKGVVTPVVSETRPMIDLNEALSDLDAAPPLGRMAMVW
ncbi:alcohol dehydrogenase catalytic domain-containing protein [Euzebya pacifica]|uniref:alcohol dehydrogenase catalytic domain-containing protein n=1 Tax=Euzebya pacifica TaxID=1608957 RepID=UPI0030F6C3BB